MTVNSLQPAFIKIIYVQNLLEHSQTIPVLPSGTVTPGVAPSLQTAGGGSVGMAAALASYMDVFVPLFGTDTLVNYAEFWSQPTAESDPIWIWTEALGLAGTSGTASVDLLQAVTTFRTAIGGIYRSYLMEISGVVSVNFRTTWPFSAGIFKDFADYLIDDDSWLFGRDNARLIVPIAFTTKYNDALRKKRGLV